MDRFRQYLKEKKRKQEINAEGLDGYDWYEGQTKWPITRIIKVVFCTISILVWALLLFRLCTMSNSDFEKMILLDEKAAAVYPEKTSQVLRINSSTEAQEDGSVLVFYPVYLEETQNLQFTVRINEKMQPPGEGGLGYTFLVRRSSSDGTEYYPLSYFLKDTGFQYTFYRLCFDSVPMEEGSVYTFLMYRGEKEPENTGEPYPVTASDFHFTLLNSETYCRHVTPDKSLFQTLD